jgi:heme A synthase
LTVLWLLPPQVSIAHACLGQTVFCLVVCLAKATSPSWNDTPRRQEDAGWPSLRSLSVGVASLAGVQLLIGALLRHTGQGLAWHVLGAAFLFTGCGGLIVRVHRMGASAEQRRGSRRLGGLLGLQGVLGALALAQREHVGIITAHVALGALVLVQTVALAWDAQRLTRSRRVAGYVPAVPEQVAA